MARIYTNPPDALEKLSPRAWLAQATHRIAVGSIRARNYRNVVPFIRVDS